LRNKHSDKNEITPEKRLPNSFFSVVDLTKEKMSPGEKTAGITKIRKPGADLFFDIDFFAVLRYNIRVKEGVKPYLLCFKNFI